MAFQNEELGAGYCICNGIYPKGVLQRVFCLLIKAESKAKFLATLLFARGKWELFSVVPDDRTMGSKLKSKERLAKPWEEPPDRESSSPVE